MFNIKENYQQFLNGMGLLAKTKVATIPDPKLMIGSAESLAPQNVLVYKNYTDANYNMLTKKLNNIENTKAEYGIEDGFITLEFTETFAAESSEMLEQLLKELIKLQLK